MKIMPCASQKTEAITFSAERWSFDALVGFRGFSATLQTAYWTQAYGNEPTFHPSSQNIRRKKSARLRCNNAKPAVESSMLFLVDDQQTRYPSRR